MRCHAAEPGAVTSTISGLTSPPSLAYRVTDALSVGAGMDVQYAYAKLVSALLAGDRPPFDPDPFAPDRFQGRTRTDAANS